MRTAAAPATFIANSQRERGISLVPSNSRERSAIVTVAKGLWASIQGDPVFMRRVNGWLTIFWIAMIPISMMMGWLNSVVYVSALSLWALVSGHWSAWQAARVEVNQEKAAKELAQEDTAGDVVEALIERTDVQPA
jgi:hypothetical protein